MREGFARAVLAMLLVVFLVLLVSASAFASDKVVPASHLKKITLIHWASDVEPGKTDPGVRPANGGDPAPKDNTHYELLGFKWASTPVTYRIDLDSAPPGGFQAIQAAFEAWDAETDAELFSPAVVDNEAAPSLDSPDGQNTVSFRLLAGLPKALAITNIWYQGTSMIETDVVFNTKYTWAVDPDGEGPLMVPTKTRYYEVRNVATHEAGHVLGLADLYGSTYSELSMFGYSAARETKKISLEEGDIWGVRYLY